MKKWEDYNSKDILPIQKSYYYYLKCYFLSKGYRDYDGGFSKNNDFGKQFFVDTKGACIGIIFYNNKSVDEKSNIEQIFLTNYILYPKIIDGMFIQVIRIPYPNWGYGFLEEIIKTLDKYLLDDIYEQKGVYKELLFNSNERLKNIQMKAKENNFPPITGKMTGDDKKKMMEIKFEPKILSYELYKTRKSPNKDLNIINEIIK